MRDIVQRIRSQIAFSVDIGDRVEPLLAEAVDEIVRLRVAEAILRKVALWEPAVFDEFFEFTDAELAVVAALTTETGEQ